MKKWLSLFICFVFAGCQTNSEIDIWQRTEETDMRPLGYYIMEKDDVARLEKLMDEQPDIKDNTDQVGNSLLHVAAYYNALKCTKLLILKGAGIDKRNGSGETPLMRACGETNFGIIELLVEAGADVNENNRTGNTPLMFAIAAYCEGRTDSLYEPLNTTLLYLIKHGANVNYRGSELGNSVLGMAEFYKAKPVVELLVKHGAR